jgi:hypothetical protein
MFFSYTFLLKSFYENEFIPESFSTAAGTKLSIIIPVSSDLGKYKKKYLEKLNAATFNFAFALTPSGSNLTTQSLNVGWNAISTFFFLPNYIKKGGSYLLIVDEVLPNQQMLVNQAERHLHKQGIFPISKNYLNVAEQPANQVNEYCYFHNLVSSQASPSTDHYSRLFADMVADKALNKQIIVVVEGEEDFNRQKEFIINFEQWVYENQRFYIELFLAYKRNNDNLLEIKNENKKLKFRIDNYNDYLLLLRKTAKWHVDEYHRIHREKDMLSQRSNVPGFDRNENYASSRYNYDTEIQKELESVKASREAILDWYKKEYELLPLWYKRFGHVIKVMMGKRSFKSLYR